MGWRAFEICQNYDFSSFSTQTSSHSWLQAENWRHTRILRSSVPHEQRLKFFSRILPGHGSKYKTAITVAFFKFTLNLTLWREGIFNLCSRRIRLYRIRVLSALGLKVTRNDWKFWLKIIFGVFKTVSSPSKPAFLEIFKSEPSNPHGWNACL